MNIIEEVAKIIVSIVATALVLFAESAVPFVIRFLNCVCGA